MKHLMQQFENPVLSPNLPKNQVKSVAINYNAKKTQKSLNKLGIDCLEILPNSKISSSVSSHPDIRIMHYWNNILYCDNSIIIKEHRNFLIRRIGEEIQEKYPYDVKLNCVCINDKLICNKNTISKEILEQAESDNLKIINTKQGYTKCSICVVDENCIITDDESIYKSTQNYFDDVLFISKGSIKLEGMNYGFIGGATGKLNKNVLAFNGRLDSHPNCNEIIDILSKYNVKPIELINDRLTDIGSIIPLTEITT